MWKFILVLFYLDHIISDNVECPAGSIRPPHSRFCYTFNSKFLDAYGAESECELQNGTLAYIDSAITNDVIGKKAKELTWDLYWIGANAVQQSSNDVVVRIWTWIGTDRFLKFTDWYQKEPNPINDCAVGKTSDFTWKTVDCAETRHFVCSVPVKINYCDVGWTYFDESNSCYKIFYNQTWNGAENVCRGENAHLTSIHSDNENNFLFGLAQSHCFSSNIGNGTWIGLYTPSTDGSVISSYKWSDSSLTNYSHWQPGQPDLINETCVHIYPHLSTWNNLPCQFILRNFVCKKLANAF